MLDYYVSHLELVKKRLKDRRDNLVQLEAKAYKLAEVDKEPDNENISSSSHSYNHDASASSSSPGSSSDLFAFPTRRRASTINKIAAIPPFGMEQDEQKEQQQQQQQQQQQYQQQEQEDGHNNVSIPSIDWKLAFQSEHKARLDAEKEIERLNDAIWSLELANSARKDVPPSPLSRRRSLSPDESVEDQQPSEKGDDTDVQRQKRKEKRRSSGGAEGNSVKKMNQPVTENTSDAMQSELKRKDDEIERLKEVIWSLELANTAIVPKRRSRQKCAQHHDVNHKMEDDNRQPVNLDLGLDADVTSRLNALEQKNNILKERLDRAVCILEAEEDYSVELERKLEKMVTIIEENSVMGETMHVSNKKKRNKANKGSEKDSVDANNSADNSNSMPTGSGHSSRTGRRKSKTKTNDSSNGKKTTPKRAKKKMKADLSDLPMAIDIALPLESSEEVSNNTATTSATTASNSSSSDNSTNHDSTDKNNNISTRNNNDGIVTPKKKKKKKVTDKQQADAVSFLMTPTKRNSSKFKVSPAPNTTADQDVGADQVAKEQRPGKNADEVLLMLPKRSSMPMVPPLSPAPGSPRDATVTTFTPTNKGKNKIFPRPTVVSPRLASTPTTPSTPKSGRIDSTRLAYMIFKK